MTAGNRPAIIGIGRRPAVAVAVPLSGPGSTGRGDGSAIAAGFAANLVTTSDLMLDGFGMHCVDFRAPGVAGPPGAKVTIPKTK
jgi:hypothetical protein